MRNDKDEIMNGEKTRKIFFQSVTQAARKKTSE